MAKINGSALKIESSVPLPPGAGKRGGSKYPFSEMNVGDSFLIDDIKDRNSVLSCVINFRNRENRPNFRIITRQVPEGYRVWRVQ